MRSRIYEGSVEHVRLKPALHRLRYDLYFYCIDLDELQELDRGLPLFGYNRMRPVSIHDSDYLDAGPGTIKAKVSRLLEQNGLLAEVQDIFLVTQPRYFVGVFNPVSFYYCLGRDGTPRCVVTEVNNTFGERHVYLLKDARDGSGAYPAVYTTDKAFHVSPFNDVSGSYELSFSRIGDEIDIRVDLVRGGDKVFSAQLLGKARPLDTRGQLTVILRHPLIPRLTIPRIYWEAARLFFLRKLSYIPKPLPLSPMTIRRNPPTAAQKWVMHAMEKLLHGIGTGRLDIVLPDGAVRSYGQEKPPSRTAVMMINDYGFFGRVAFGGEIGLGEGYVEGLWDSGDLTGLLGLLIENRAALKEGNTALAALSQARNLRLHLKRANTPAGSRSNIAEHYDLSNDFYKCFLDSTMTYSCGIFQSPGDSLEDSQRNKFRAVIQKAGITGSDHVLEIGCGWGGFAVEAVKATGCRITGITLSRAQYDYARDRVRREGLEDRIEILLEDYRAVRGAYDRIVSIEMLEAVGHENLGLFFMSCDRLLKPGGLVVLQVITIPDARYARYRSEANWISTHVFPGGHLPSFTALCSAMAGHSRLQVEHVENIGVHYAETLKQWRENLTAHRDELSGMGFDRATLRKWVYYFSLCEAQFALRALNDLQIVLTREGKVSHHPAGPGL